MGLSPQAEATAPAAETLYRERKLSVAAIVQKLHVSRSTLYSYLRHRGAEIGRWEAQVHTPAPCPKLQAKSAGSAHPTCASSY